MSEEKSIFEPELEAETPDPDEPALKDRKLITQPYDLVVESLSDQIKGGTIFLRPLSDRPNFQRQYVWTDVLASKLIESILLNVPIPPCYLSQNDDFELDVVDGQQHGCRREFGVRADEDQHVGGDGCLVPGQKLRRLVDPRLVLEGHTAGNSTETWVRREGQSAGGVRGNSGIRGPVFLLRRGRH